MTEYNLPDWAKEVAEPSGANPSNVAHYQDLLENALDLLEKAMLRGERIEFMNRFSIVVDEHLVPTGIPKKGDKAEWKRKRKAHLHLSARLDDLLNPEPE